MTRIIGIVSGKGGAGKTTIASNLSYALTELGKDITTIDTNLTTPHLGLHLGFQLVPKSLHDFLRGDAKLQDVIYYHPFGFKIIPAGLSVSDLVGIDPDKLQDVTLNLIGKTDIIILDSAPSLGREATLSLKLADEILLVANPNLPSVLDVLKVANVAKKLNKNILGIVVNRVSKQNDLTSEQIEDIVKYPVIAEVPEDVDIQRALSARTAVIDYNYKSKASVEIRRLAHHLVGKKFNYNPGFWKRLVSAFK
ncbi:MAG: P-loop NTPase [Candidatus Aenigmarchaeota archaeon]|nr:P-loop NTPase [Candidatus Aenigmarchaeota archaeon]